MAANVFVDAAGAQLGGGARFRIELYQYMAQTKRSDIKLVGVGRRLGPAWLLRREIARSQGRRVALNNVSFVTPGGERWTRLGNALHFLTNAEAERLGPILTPSIHRQAAVVRLAARRSHVLVTPCSAMAERVTTVLPELRSRVIPRLNPVSTDWVPELPREPKILCPVLFSPYKRMEERLTDLLNVLDNSDDEDVRLRVTADRAEVSDSFASNPRVELIGRLRLEDLRQMLGRSRAIYFPTGIESFGYPLAEARVSGHPVIAQDTEQNREIAGSALCGFTPGQSESLGQAVHQALTRVVSSDPGPFDPGSYFDWLLGSPQ